MIVKTLKKISRAVFYSFCVVLWLVVSILVLEVAAALLQRNMEAENPLIEAYKQQRDLPLPKCAVDIPSVAIAYPSEIGGWDTKPPSVIQAASLKRALAEKSSASSFDADLRVACRKHFSDYTTEEKEAYARLFGEVVVVVDTDFNIYDVYGIDAQIIDGISGLVLRFLLFITGNLREMQHLATTTLNTQQPNSRTVYLPNSDEPQEQHHFEAFPAPGGKYVLVFINVHPEDVYAPPVPQPDSDSRWEVPFFRYKPNYPATDDNSLQTNRLGFRSPEIAIPKPENIFRILCVGGSTTDEAGEENLTYPSKLEMLLTQTFPGQVIEVVNAGTPGIYSKGHLLRLHEYLRIEPNMVILLLGVNDTLNIYDNPVTNIPAKKSNFLNLFFPAIAAPSCDSFEKSLTADMGCNLQLLTTQFQRHGIAVVFASMPYPDPQAITREQRQFFQFQGRLAWDIPAFSLKQYVAYINVSNKLLKTISEETHSVYIPLAESMAQVTTVYKDFCHMSQPGINAKAQLIFEGIEPLVAQRLDNQTK